MSKCNDIRCDLCGEHITNNEVLYNCTERYSTIKIKAKKFWSLFHESGWNKITIDICPSCQIKIKKIMRGDKK